MSIWKYADRFTQTPAEFRISLGEGNTPVVRSRKIGPAAGLKNLWFKMETGNPTGSYKDRFAAAAISDMCSRSVRHCVSTSSGNTGAALAAYCTAAGMTCEIATVDGAPAGKLRQMMVYGAKVYMIRGFGIDPDVTERAFKYVAAKGSKPGRQMQISAFSSSPVGMSGVQTIGYELDEQMERIDHVFVPAGGGGLTFAVARGLAGSRTKPAVHLVQPEGNDTIAGALRGNRATAQAVNCTSRISGLQVPTPLDGEGVIAACRASGGTGHLMTDASIWEAHKRMAMEEGLFCEPAAATAVAGAIQAVKQGEIAADSHVVCIVTGVGFKDMATVERMLADRPCPTVELASLDPA